MNVGLAVCLSTLIGLIVVVKLGLNILSAMFGPWAYLAICIGITTVMVLAAFAWDYYESRQQPPSQEVLPPRTPPYPPSRRLRR